MSGKTPLDPPESASFGDGHRFAVRRAFEAGRTEHASVTLPFDRFGARVAHLVRSRLAASPEGESEERIGQVLASVPAADLYLAIACDEGAENSWRRLTEAYIPRLRGLLLGRRMRPDRVEELLEELPGWLATPPPGGRARTRTGTYDGSGSLFAWLAVIVIRREADRARRGARRSGVDLSTVDPAGSAEMDPLNAAGDTEAARRFREAIRRAWSTLTEKESAVLLALYRDGLRQKEIARLLGVGKARVSQLVKKGVERLRQEIAWSPEGSEPDTGSEGSWKRLGEAVTSYLATLSHSRDIQE